MTNLDIITKSKIQNRVESIVIKNADEDGFVKFDLVKENIAQEFGASEEVIAEAKKQYDFMFEF